MSHKDLHPEVEAWLSALGRSKLPDPAFVRFDYDSGYEAMQKLRGMGFEKSGFRFPKISTKRSNDYYKPRFEETDYKIQLADKCILVTVRMDSTRRPYYSTMMAKIIEGDE